jgi:hypothetical protein
MDRHHRFSHEARRLIDRLRRLVAEQRRLEDDGSSELREAKMIEIDRLQQRLATVVKRELTHSA